MHYDYGYIRGTVGTDSDHVDCYIGPDKNAKKVYVKRPSFFGRWYNTVESLLLFSTTSWMIQHISYYKLIVVVGTGDFASITRHAEKLPLELPRWTGYCI